MTSQMSPYIKNKKNKKQVLLDLSEQEKHILAVIKYYQYVLDEHTVLRQIRLDKLTKAQNELNELDTKFNDAPATIRELKNDLVKCKTKQSTVRNKEGKMQKYLRIKEQLLKLELELAACS